MSNTKTLLELKEKIDTGKIKHNKLEGQKEEALKTLKTEFKVKTIKEAKNLLKEMQKEVTKDSEVFEKQVGKLAKTVVGK